MKSTRVALQSSSCGETAKDATRVDCALAEATKCSACRPAVAAHFRQFVNTFAKEIDQRISEVQATLHPLFTSDVYEIKTYRFVYISNFSVRRDPGAGNRKITFGLRTI